MRYNNRAHHKTTFLKLIAQPQHIHIVGNAQILAHLILLDVQCADNNHNLCMILQLSKHPQLAVGLKTRQHSARMMIVKKFSTQLKIELISEMSNTLLNVLALYLKILIVVKSVFHNGMQIYIFFTQPAAFLTLKNYSQMSGSSVLGGMRDWYL